jgi:hypothetical protein
MTGDPTTPRSRECESFLEALHDTPPTVVSACDGWTVHEVTAHVAAAAAEVSRHLDPYLHGDDVPITRGFQEREAPYQALEHAALCRALEDEEQRMRGLIDRVLEREPGAVIPWTGRRMPVAKFLPHLRNEFALHRWDFAGDRDPGRELLAQPELTEHAVEVLGQILIRRGRAQDPAPEHDLRVRLRVEGQRDVRVVVAGGAAGLELTSDDDGGDEPYLEMDAAARTLVIWGRRPGERGRVTSHMPAATLARTQALLAGY